MVFFNYATMQMAAKIVYYGPGLCGKTTNLHWIYAKTAPQSRGEMVSLETETDRTLFFDLLPLDVGVIGGFKTRLQLYTVPGQVFYNTTRKLVLKGVDGIVFVADYQRAMLDANLESFRNLRENLAEIGVNVDEIPLVVQLNKRDLPNRIEKETLLNALDPERKYSTVESSAVNGEGVFETLKEISKLTLRTLRRRMMGDEAGKGAPIRPSVVQQPSRPREAPVGFNPSPAVAKGPTIPPPIAPFVPVAPAASAGTAPVTAPPAVQTMDSFSEDPFSVPAADERTFEPPPMETLLDREPSPDADFTPIPEVSPGPETFEDLLVSGSEAASVSTPAVEDPFEPPSAETETTPEEPTPSPDIPVAPPAVKHVKLRSTADIFAELDSLRRQATQGSRPKSTSSPRHAIALEFDLSQELLRTVKRLNLALLFEDEEGNVVQQREAQIDLESDRDVHNIQIKLKTDRG